MVGIFQTYMVVFRIVHIFAGVAWVGSVFFLVVYVQPSASAIGPAAAPFMGELLAKRHLVDRIIGMAVFTVVGGLFLYGTTGTTFGTRASPISRPRGSAGR